MAILKLLRGAALVVMTVGGSAFAQDPPQGANDQPSDPVTCPTPNVPPTTAQQPAQTQPTQAEPTQAPQPVETTVNIEPPAPQPAPTYTTTEPAQYEGTYGTYGWLHDYGVGLSVGGGVEDFSGSTMRDTTSTGGAWTARLTFGTHSYIAGEASYIGSAQRIQRLGLATDSDLIGNGAQAAIRINGTRYFPVQPFIYGGAAWRHYNLNTSGTNFSDVIDHAEAFELPVGVGVAGYVGGVMLEARGEYRFAWTDHDLVTGTSGTTPLMDRWGVTGNLGYSF